MESNLVIDFTVNKENKTITVNREFAAGLSLVWDAYTKSAILDQWWAPKPWKARTKSMDFSVGGTWLYAMVGPEGEEHWSIARYTQIEPQKSFTGWDAFTDPEGTINPEMPQSKWETSFKAQGDHTLVTFEITYDDLSQLEATLQMGFKEGFISAMENLDEIFANKK